jgi:hypothetical protein
MQIKTPKAVLDWLGLLASKIELPNGNTYLYVPFWIEVKKGPLDPPGMVTIHQMDNLPKELTDILTQLRDKADEITRKSGTDTPGSESGANKEGDNHPKDN